MAFKTKSRARRTAYPKRKRVARRSTARRGKLSFAKKVMKVVTRVAEHKKKEYTAGFQTAGTAGACLQLDVSLTNGFLAISQGTGQGDRIGNKIRVVKATLSYVLYPYPYHITLNPAPTPQDIRMVLARNNTDVQSTPPIGTFFQNGDTTATCSGGLTDMCKTVNRDGVSVFKDWRHKVAPSVFATLSGGAASSFYGANNDYKLNVLKKVDITKYVPKVIDYLDTAGTTSKSLFWNVFCADADGTIGGSTYTIQGTYTIDFTFVDF